jgi:hypothetical protein
MMFYQLYILYSLNDDLDVEVTLWPVGIQTFGCRAEEDHKNLSQNNELLGRGSNPGCAEYDAGMLVPFPQCVIQSFWMGLKKLYD